jgi:hypothetical protein
VVPLPFSVWAQFITACLLLLAFPALQAAAVLQGMDRVAGTSFFLPSGLVKAGQPVQVAAGGSALHMFLTGMGTTISAFFHRMKGVYEIQSQDDYAAWLEEEAAYLDDPLAAP